MLGAHLSGFSNPPDCTPATPQCSLSGGWNNDPSFFAFYRLSQYHDVMAAAGDDDKKIWLTEFGYDSSTVAVPGYEYSTYDLGGRPGALPGPGVPDRAADARTSAA